MRVSVADLTVDLPEGWFDVTDDSPESGPTTLARIDGVGVIQFSVGKYQGGIVPNIDDAALGKLLRTFGETRGLGIPTNVGNGEGQNLFVVGDFALNDEFVRAWYVSNGRDIALVTYVSQQPDCKVTIAELRDAETVIESLEF